MSLQQGCKTVGGCMGSQRQPPGTGRAQHCGHGGCAGGSRPRGRESCSLLQRGQVGPSMMPGPGTGEGPDPDIDPPCLAHPNVPAVLTPFSPAPSSTNWMRTRNARSSWTTSLVSCRREVKVGGWGGCRWHPHPGCLGGSWRGPLRHRAAAGLCKLPGRSCGALAPIAYTHTRINSHSADLPPVAPGRAPHGVPVGQRGSHPHAGAGGHANCRCLLAMPSSDARWGCPVGMPVSIFLSDNHEPHPLMKPISGLQGLLVMPGGDALSSAHQWCRYHSPLAVPGEDAHFGHL